MNAYEKTFDWLQFPEGRTRFSGTKRGWDEKGHVTFSLEIDGMVRHGEMDQVFLENGSDYNIEILSFGCGRGEDVGMPGAQAAIGQDLLKAARSLITSLIQAGLGFKGPPNILMQTSDSHFMGRFHFGDGWAAQTQRGNAGTMEAER